MREDIDRYEGGLELFSRGYEKLGFMHSFVAWAIVNRYVLLFLECALTKLKPLCSNQKFLWSLFVPIRCYLLKNICLLFQSAALIGDCNNWNPNADIMTGIYFRMLTGKDAPDVYSGIKFSFVAMLKTCGDALYVSPFISATPYIVNVQSEKYEFQHPQPKRPKLLRIYEARVGMSGTACFSFILLTITQCF
ncbi:hypothetical protein Patl1_32458 [Pistacia atlantica]|uniref:Uncharacterized protein n=1 Tax=Pistacia atlantica TaxID=434234 RepID=A0ACC1ARR4_9ROSI|nr:hypothetical protein Patl1_32458 [Pistacia atlantica]